MSKAAELAALIGSQTAQGNKNLVINGSMKVSQRATSSTGLGAASSYPTLDRFQLVNSSTNSGRLTMSQDATTDLVGFGNAMKFDCTTADTSIAADEVSILRYSFEGQDLQSLGYNSVSAKSVTISFYVKGNAAATYTFELQEPENGRTIAQEFSVTTSWSRVQLTFPGDTGGSLSNDNSGRFRLHIFLHAGSNYTGGTFAGNSWISTVTNTRVGDNQTSFFDSTNRTFFITGLQMEIGDVATPFEHEDIGTTLEKCKRYFQIHDDMHIRGYAAGSTQRVEQYFAYSVEMRANPTRAVITAGSSSNVRSTDTTYSGLVLGNKTGGAILSLEANGAGIAYIENREESLDAEL